MNKFSRMFLGGVGLCVALGLIMTPAVVAGGSNKAEKETEVTPYLLKVFGAHVAGGYLRPGAGQELTQHIRELPEVSKLEAIKMFIKNARERLTEHSLTESEYQDRKKDFDYSRDASFEGARKRCANEWMKFLDHYERKPDDPTDIYGPSANKYFLHAGVLYSGCSGKFDSAQNIPDAYFPIFEHMSDTLHPIHVTLCNTWIDVRGAFRQQPCVSDLSGREPNSKTFEWRHRVPIKRKRLHGMGSLDECLTTHRPDGADLDGCTKCPVEAMRFVSRQIGDSAADNSVEGVKPDAIRVILNTQSSHVVRQYPGFVATTGLWGKDSDPFWRDQGMKQRQDEMLSELYQTANQSGEDLDKEGVSKSVRKIEQARKDWEGQSLGQ